MLFIVLCFFALFSVHSAHHNEYQYCLCGHDFIYDPEREYNTSSMFDLENACYPCLIVNASGSFYYSGSLPNLGFLTCEEPGALQARLDKCTAFGGIIPDIEHSCVTTHGANQSQSTGCGELTTSPTSGSSPISGGSLLMTAAVTLGAAVLGLN